MRLDYALFALAVVFFVITISSVIFLSGTDQTLWIIASGMLGILSLGLGFIQRPKPTAQPTAATAQTPKEELPAQTAPVTETPVIPQPTGHSG